MSGSIPTSTRIYKGDSIFTNIVTFSQDVTITGDLTVNGTTTTINSTTIDVDDKNITLGQTTNASDILADGGGITLRGTTDKTFIWELNENELIGSAWNSSENINLAAGKKLLVDGNEVYARLANSTFSGTLDATSAVLNASTLTARTMDPADSSTNVATTAYVTGAISAEAVRATGIEGGLRTDVNANAAAISAEEVRATGIEGGLRTDVNANAAAISAEEVRATGIEGGLRTDVNANAAAISAEEVRATGIEGGLRTDVNANAAAISAEEVRATGIEGGLRTDVNANAAAISAEEVRATGIEGGLRTDVNANAAAISAEEVRATGIEGGLRTDVNANAAAISAEEVRATGIEGGLRTDVNANAAAISAEEVRATGIEGGLRTDTDANAAAISAEEVRATGIEGGLRTDVNANAAAISAEEVRATGIEGGLRTDVNANAAAISAEEVRATGIEGGLRTDTDANAAAISAEEVRATGIEGGLRTDVNANAAAISAEEVRATGIEGGLRTDVNANAAAISAEEVRATGIEGGLRTDVNANAAAISAEEVRATGIEGGLRTDVNLKAPLASPTFSGTVNAAGAVLNAGTVNAVDLTLSGNLIVNGTTTTINATDLSVTDKNIIIGQSNTPSDASASGGGITLQGTTDKTFNWVSSANGGAWTSSENMNLVAGKKLLVDGDEVYARLASPSFSGTVDATGAVLNASTLTATTMGPADSSTNVATTAYVTGAISAEEVRATGIEGGLRTDVNANAAAISAEAVRATGIEGGLRTDVNANAAAISAEEVRATGIEGGLRTDVNANAAAISAEEVRATGIEGGLRTDVNANAAAISAEEVRATGIEGGLRTDVNANAAAISAEEVRATGIEGGLRTDVNANAAAISAEEVRATGIEGGLRTDVNANAAAISAEEVRATGIEGGLRTDVNANAAAISAEEVRATGIEGGLRTDTDANAAAISAEEVRATGIEGGLRTDVNANAAAISAEEVRATGIEGGLRTDVNANAAAISAEEVRATGIEGGLRTDTDANAAAISAEEVRATGIEGGLRTDVNANAAAISAEEVRATGIEGGLRTDVNANAAAISAEEVRATGIEGGLRTDVNANAAAISAEEVRATGIEGGLRTDTDANAAAISAEEVRATGIEGGLRTDVNANAAAISAEEVRATGIEGGLRTDVNANAAAISAEEVRATGIEGGLRTDVNANATAISAEEVRATGIEGGLRTDVNLKAPLASPTFSGTVNAAGAVLNAGTVNAVDLTLSGNLIVNGTTTTINATDLSVTDKNIIIGQSNTPSDASASGGGITLQGTTDKTFNWVSSANGGAWTSSENMNLVAGKKLLVDGDEVYARLASPSFSGTVDATGAVLNASTLTATTMGPADSSTNVATTAYVTGAISAEEVRATGIEGGLRTDVNANAAAISAEEVRATGIEGGLRTDVNANAAAISAEEVRATGIEGGLRTDVNANAAAISAEEVRATGIEGGLRTDVNANAAAISAEEVRATGIEGGLRTDVNANAAAISAEEVRATGIEGGLRTDVNANAAAISAEEVRATGIEGGLRTDVNANAAAISAEEVRATGIEGGLRTDVNANAAAISAEEVRATGIEGGLRTDVNANAAAISAEEVRATGIEGGLRTDVNANAAAISAEEVRATGIEGGLRTDVNANAAAISAEEVRATCIEGGLRTDVNANAAAISAEEVRATGIEGGLRTDVNANAAAISAEEVRATGIEGGLRTDVNANAAAISAEEVRATGIEGGLRTDVNANAAAISAEEVRATGIEGGLRTDVNANAAAISAEEVRATGIEGGLRTDTDANTAAISNEIARATGIEGGLRTDVNANATAISAEEVRATGIEGGLRTDTDANATAISNEAARATGIEGGLRTDTDANAAAISNEAARATGVEDSLRTDVNLKAPLASPTFSGTVDATGAVLNASTLTATTVTSTDNSTNVATTAFVKNVISAELGNVDNTSDALKPISNATQIALNDKASLESPTFTGTLTFPRLVELSAVKKITRYAAPSIVNNPNRDITYSIDDLNNGMIIRAISSPDGDFTDTLSTSVLDSVLPDDGDYCTFIIQNISGTTGESYNLRLIAAVTGGLTISNGNSISNGGEILVLTSYMSLSLLIRRYNNDFIITLIGTGNINELKGYTYLAFPMEGESISISSLDNKSIVITGDSTNFYTVTMSGTLTSNLSNVIDKSNSVVANITDTSAVTNVTNMPMFKYLFKKVRVNDGATLTLTAEQATGLNISGLGTVEITGLTATADLANVSTSIVSVAVSDSIIFTGTFPTGATTTTTVDPAIIMTLPAAKANGQIINGAGSVTLNTAVLSGQTFAGLTSSGTITFVGGNLPDSMPATFVNNAPLTIAASVANGKTITGTGVVTVSDAILSTQAFGSLPSGTVFALGGVADVSMPASFVTNDALSITAAVANGKTITGTGVVTVSDAILSAQAFDYLPSGTVFALGGVADVSMPSSFVTNDALSITAAVANGKTITGTGVVTVSDAILSAQAFGSLPSGTVFALGGVASTTAMPSSFETNAALSITAAVANGKTITGTGVVTVSDAILSTQAFGSLPSGTVFALGGVADVSMPASFVTNDALSITAAIASGKEITGSGVVTVSDAISSSQAFGSLPSGTVFALGGVASTTAMPSSFETNAALSITAAIANGKTITGSGVVTVSDAILSAQAFDYLPSGTVFALGGVADVSMPASFVTNDALSITAAVANGKTITGTGVVTVSDAILSAQAFDYLPSGTVFALGGVADVSMPSSFVTNDALSITAAVANGKTITGTGVVTVSDAILSAQAFGSLPSGTVFALGGVADVSMPASFVTNDALSITAAVANGKTITGTGVVTVSDAILSTQAFGSLPSGTVFALGGVADVSMPASFVTNDALSITAAIASGKEITGSGVVTVSDAISSSQAFGSLPSGTVFALGGVASTTAMPSSFETNAALSITAAIANGKTITGSGVVTVSDAILSAQAFDYLPSGTVFALGGVADVSMPASFVTNDALSITAAVANGKTITGTGVVTVSDAILSAQAFDYLPSGTVFALGGVADVSMPSSFVTNDALSITAAVANGKTITGTGVVTVSDAILSAQAFGSLPSGTVFALGGVADVSMPASFVTNDALSITAAVANGKTITGTGVVTVSDAILSTQAFGSLPSGTVFALGGVADVSMPASFVTNDALSITAAIASGKEITGSGVVTVSDAISSSQAFGSLPSGTVFALGGVASTTAMPSSFETNAALSITAAIANGKTITGSGVVTVSDAILSAQAFDYLPSGTVFALGGVADVSMPASFVTNDALSITAAVANGKTITGTGVVTVSDAILSAQAFDYLPSGTVFALGGVADVSMPSSFVTNDALSITAAVANGKTITGTGVVTVSDAILSAQAFGSLPSGTVFALGGVADVSMPASFVTNDALSITAAVANGKTITGTGVVTVSDAILSAQAFGSLPSGTVFALGGVADVSMPASFVTNDALSITAAIASGKEITGSGVVTVSDAISSSQAFGSLPSGTVFALGGVASTTAMPSSFETNAALSITAAIANGKTITGSGVVTVSDAILSAQAFDYLPSGTVFALGGVADVSMPASFVTNDALSITAAVANGKTITGTGVVTVSDAILSAQAFDYLPSGTVFALGGVADVSMPASFVTNDALSITAAVANGKTITGTGVVTVSDAILSAQAFGSLPSGTVFALGGVADVSMPASFVTNDALSITAAVANGKTITGTGVVTVSDAILSAQAFGSLPSGTVFALGGVADVSMPASFVTNDALSITAAIASGKEITGSGVVTVSDAISSSQAFGSLPSGTVFALGGVASTTAMPSSFETNAALSITAAIANGKTITGSGVVTVSDAILSAQAFDYLPSGTVFALGGVADVSMPASFVTNDALSITAAVANGKTITGTGVVTVSDAILSAQAFDYLPSGTVFALGGVADVSMPASFVTNDALSITAAVANGKTITGTGVVTVSDAILSAQAFGSLPSGTVFALGGVADVSMPASFVTNDALSITAAVANGKTITGTGVVTVSDAILSTQAFGSLPSGTVFDLGGVADVSMPAFFVTNDALSITAAVANGKTITGTGVVTVSDAILSAQAFGSLPSGTVFALGGVADVSMPSSFVTNDALSITAAVANGKTITGTGVVTVSDAILSAQAFGSLPSGTVFALGGVASATAMPASFVTNAALSITAAIANGKEITGSGVVTVSNAILSTQAFGSLPSGTVFNAGGVASATAMPATFVTNDALSITAAIANGKTITGTGVVTVSNAILSTQAFGSLPSGTVFSLGGVASATAMPSSFVTNAALSITAAIANGKIVTGTGVVTVSNAILSTQAFGSLPSGTVFALGGVADVSMPSSFVTNAALSITAAIANGKIVTGTGVVTVSDEILSTQAFGYLQSGTVFDAGGVTSSLPVRMPGITLTVRTSPSNKQWKSVAYGNGLWVAVADSGFGNRVMTSTDSINWTNIDAHSYSWNSVAYGDGLWVAVAYDGILNSVMTSQDGITWTRRAAATTDNWSSVAYGDGLWVAVANQGSGSKIMTSLNGITWTSRNAVANIAWRSVAYGNGLWVAVSSDASGKIITSANGIDWTVITVTAAQIFNISWSSVAYGNGLWVAVSRNSSGKVMTSADGTNWTVITVTGAYNNWTSVAYGNGLWVAVAESGDNRVMTSPDGISWTLKTSPANNLWQSVAYGNEVWVAVASDGVSRIMRGSSEMSFAAVMPASFVTNAALSINAAAANGKTVTGTGVVTVSDAILSTQAFGSLPSGTVFALGGVADVLMPSSFITNAALSITAAVANGKTITGTGVVTVSDAILSAQAFGSLPSGTVFNAGGVAPASIPATFVTNAALSITAAVANGKEITGTGVVTVSTAILSSQAFGSLPSGTVFDLGGVADVSMPASFVTNAALSIIAAVANGKTITGSGVVTVSDAILSTQAFGSLPSGTVFALGGVADVSMPASFVTNDALSITAAIANGKTITGTGVVTVSDAILSAQAFGSLPSGTVFALGGVADVSMPASFVTNDALSITAAVANGKTITGTGVVTVSDAILSAQAFDYLPSGTVFALGGVADVSMPASFVTNDALSITAAVANGKTITGTGVVTVSDAILSAQAFGSLPSGTVFALGGVADVSMPASFVTNDALSITAAVANGKTITGTGVVTVSDAILSTQAFGSLPSGTVFDLGGVADVSMPASFVTNAALSITAAVASGKQITGTGDLVINELGTVLFSAANISTSGAITYITSNATQTLNASTTLYTSNTASSHSLLIRASQTLTCAVNQIATTGQEIIVAQWSGVGVGTVDRLSTNASMIVNLNNNTDANLSNITLNTVTYQLSSALTGTHTFLNSSQKINLFLNNYEYTVGSDVAMTNQLRNDIGTNAGLAKLNVYDSIENLDGLYIFYDYEDSDQDRTKPLSLSAAKTAADISTAAGTKGYGYTTQAEQNADGSRTAGALKRSTGTYTDIAGIVPMQNPGQGYGVQYQTITIRDTSMETLVNNSDQSKAGTLFQIFAYNFNLIKSELF